MSFLQSILDFFKRLFGGEDTPPPRTGQPTPQPTASGTSSTSSTSKSVKAVVRRHDQRGDAIIGTLLLNGEEVGETLESRVSHVPAGKYPLSLRTSGGLHATYAYKYPEIHRGILHIQAKSPEFAYLRSGGTLDDVHGGIVVAGKIQRTENGAEAWNSEATYRSVYSKLAHEDAVELEIVEVYS